MLAVRTSARPDVLTECAVGLPVPHILPLEQLHSRHLPGLEGVFDRLDDTEC